MKLSAREKYSYGIGALGKDMICGVHIYLCNGLFYRCTENFSIYRDALSCKVLDAINDLGMGMVVDNTKTRWGKFRPWLAVGTLINAVVFACLFTDWDYRNCTLCVCCRYVCFVGDDIPLWISHTGLCP